MRRLSEQWWWLKKDRMAYKLSTSSDCVLWFHPQLSISFQAWSLILFIIYHQLTTGATQSYQMADWCPFWQLEGTSTVVDSQQEAASVYSHSVIHLCHKFRWNVSMFALCLITRIIIFQPPISVSIINLRYDTAKLLHANIEYKASFTHEIFYEHCLCQYLSSPSHYVTFTWLLKL